MGRAFCCRAQSPMALATSGGTPSPGCGCRAHGSRSMSYGPVVIRPPQAAQARARGPSLELSAARTATAARRDCGPTRSRRVPGEFLLDLGIGVAATSDRAGSVLGSGGIAQPASRSGCASRSARGSRRPDAVLARLPAAARQGGIRVRCAGCRAVLRSSGVAADSGHRAVLLLARGCVRRAGARDRLVKCRSGDAEPLGRRGAGVALRRRSAPGRRERGRHCAASHDRAGASQRPGWLQGRRCRGRRRGRRPSRAGRPSRAPGRNCAPGRPRDRRGACSRGRRRTPRRRRRRPGLDGLAPQQDSEPGRRHGHPAGQLRLRPADGDEGLQAAPGARCIDEAAGRGLDGRRAHWPASRPASRARMSFMARARLADLAAVHELACPAVGAVPWPQGWPRRHWRGHQPASSRARPRVRRAPHHLADRCCGGPVGCRGGSRGPASAVPSEAVEDAVDERLGVRPGAVADVVAEVVTGLVAVAGSRLPCPRR